MRHDFVLQPRMSLPPLVRLMAVVCNGIRETTRMTASWLTIDGLEKPSLDLTGVWPGLPHAPVMFSIRSALSVGRNKPYLRETLG